MDKVESMVLKPQQLAHRWQVSLTKIYEDNNAGKLPHLKINRNRFPIKAIEEMECELDFNEIDIPTPLERRLKRKVNELEEILTLKDKEIAKLKLQIARAQAFLTETIYLDVKESIQMKD